MSFQDKIICYTDNNKNETVNLQQIFKFDLNINSKFKKKGIYH